jgi:hypothetical protein
VDGRSLDDIYVLCFIVFRCIQPEEASYGF